jgi:creatinine amidohydrolase
MHETIHYEKLKWPEINKIASGNKVVLIPIGSLEGHGEHLPLDTDIIIPSEICKLVAKKIPKQVILMPGIPYGYSKNHMVFPGSISIEEHTLIEFLAQICFSLVSHGFDRILFVNGHGGNVPILDLATRKINLTNQKVLCASLAWYLIPEVRKKFEEVNPFPSKGSMTHAGMLETSVYLAICEKAVSMEKAKPVELPSEKHVGFGTEDAPVMMMRPWSSYTETGVLGHPEVATPKIGKELLKIAVSALEKIIEEFRKIPIKEPIDLHI